VVCWKRYWNKRVR